MKKNKNNLEQLAPTRPLTQDEAAAFLGLTSGKTLYHWRQRGDGPRFMKCRNGRNGKLLRYRRCDLEAWLRRQIVTPAAGVAR